MSTASYSRRNLHFLLYEVLDVLSLTSHSYFAAHDAESFNMVLDTAEGIAARTMRPYLKESDKQVPELINGNVKVHPALREYYKAFCESGLLAACFDEQYGGQQLPKTVYATADFIVGNAHNGFEMFTSLSGNAARLLISFASRQLVNEYAVKILNGEYTATMCLTETQAGSSLSDITTTAYPQGDGTYKINGQKIFISGGDHDITDNIIHLVLARVEGAPKGTKGISLFIVPKRKLDDTGLVVNDVISIGIYHKMGQRSTPAMHLEFGANNNCIGYLIGEEGKGLLYMFQMMNSARLGVGLAGTYIASAAYYASLQYAKERPQGRRANTKNPDDPPVTIIHHPDVRRMLLLQKTFVEGSLALLLQCYKYIDLEKISDDKDTQRYNDLLELLTPVAKTYGAEMGIVSVNNGLQVLGGYGYTEDFILEQLARDVRIMSLYEGTTGIQSQALLGRQVMANNGRALQYWEEEVMRDIDAAQRFANIQCYADWLLSEIEEFKEVTQFLVGVAAKGNKELFLADANLYMELFALINIAWQWLKQGIIAQEKLNENSCSVDDRKFYKANIHSMKFFFHYELRKAKGLSGRLRDGEVLTVMLDEDLIM
jgi:alkylation response protein AidB-like acyl-CoA dehydrogenase